jgi:hypothetical protein
VVQEQLIGDLGEGGEIRRSKLRKGPFANISVLQPRDWIAFVYV